MSLVVISPDTVLHSADTSCDLLGSSAIALTLERNLICQQSLISALNLQADHVPLIQPLQNCLNLHQSVVWGPPVTISLFNPLFCDWAGTIHRIIALGEPAITGVDVSDELRPQKTPEVMATSMGCRTPNPGLFVRFNPELCVCKHCEAEWCLLFQIAALPRGL